MAQRFHAERYLRLFCERELARDRPARPGGLPLGGAAEALVAIRAIDMDVARRVVGDYARALALREPHGHAWAAMPDEPPGELVDLAVPRVVACDRTVECSWGSLYVSYVILAEDGTTVGAVGRLSPAPAAGRVGARAPRPRMPGRGYMPLSYGHSMPPTLTLGDDRGGTQDAHFSGGSGPDEFNGTYRTGAPLARDTAWIEVDGTRLEPAAEPAAVTVRVESHAGADPAPSYLRHRIATGDSRFGQEGDDIEAAIDALIAAGALGPADPVIDEVRNVLAAMGGRPPSHGWSAPHGRHGHPGGGLAEPWASVLNRSPRHGPHGSVAIGAVTPVLDGVRIAALVLTSEEECFRVTVETSPAAGSPRPGRSDRRIAWWAGDDRGNHFLGHVEGWNSHGADRAECRLVFTPALDPKATSLDLIPTTLAARAIISIPLPDWSVPS